jgi:hypothetical protein
MTRGACGTPEPRPVAAALTERSAYAKTHHTLFATPVWRRRPLGWHAAWRHVGTALLDLEIRAGPFYTTEYMPQGSLSSPGYNFDELWGLFRQTMRACPQCAKAYGMNFSIENHAHTMMPVTDSSRGYRTPFAVPFGCNLGCGWAMNPREYPTRAIYKLNKHRLNLHVRDVDAAMRRTAGT